MRVMPVYLLCATLAAAAKSEETANYFGRRLEPVEVTADQETVSYLLPRLTSKYRPNSQWSPVTDPRFYVLTEMETNGDNQVADSHLVGRRKREGYVSLSVNNPLDVLRHSVLYQMERKKMLDRIRDNRDFLNNLGDEGFKAK